MMIFGPLVRPVTSTVTLALSRPVAVTLSPSTTITTGRVRVSPAAAIASISMTSPTATFCCLLPLRTTAYTASHSPRYENYGSQELGVCARHRLELRASTPRGGRAGRCVEHRGSRLRDRVPTGQNEVGHPLPRAHRLREPFFLIGTCSTTGASPGPPEDGSDSVSAPASAASDRAGAASPTGVA